MEHSYCIATVDVLLEKKHLDIIFSLLPDGVCIAPASDDDEYCFAFMHTRELPANQVEKKVRIVKSNVQKELEAELSVWQYRASYKDRGVTFSESFSDMAQKHVDRIEEELSKLPTVEEEYEVPINHLVWEDDKVLCEQWTYRIKKALDELE